MTVYLIPPIGLDARSWRWVTIPEAVPVDLRISTRGDTSLPKLADAVAHYVAEDAGHPADIVGVSMGGMVALHLALRHPHLVRSLLLACTSAVANRQDALERAEAAMQLGMSGVIQATLERWFTHGDLVARPLPDPIVYARERLLGLNPADFAVAWRAIAEHDVRADLGRVVVPATCLAATQDVSTPEQVLARMSAKLPNSRMVIIDGSHAIHLANPASFSTAVRSHLDWVTDVVSQRHSK